VLDGRNALAWLCPGLADLLARRDRCPVLDAPRLVDVDTPDLVDLTGTVIGPAGASDRTGSVLTAVDHRVATATCNCPRRDPQENLARSAAALLLALRRRQLAGPPAA
jgi:hypothetical protein